MLNSVKRNLTLNKFMEKTIKTVKKVEYILSKEEAHYIKHCLEYCWHRLVKHSDKCGLQKLVGREKVESLLEDLNS